MLAAAAGREVRRAGKRKDLAAGKTAIKDRRSGKVKTGDGHSRKRSRSDKSTDRPEKPGSVGIGSATVPLFAEGNTGETGEFQKGRRRSTT
jgi:hypothetical protein